MKRSPFSNPHMQEIQGDRDKATQPSDCSCTRGEKNPTTCWRCDGRAREFEQGSVSIETWNNQRPGAIDLQGNLVAVRLTHEPTGCMVALCGPESQQRLKESAMDILMALVYS